MRVLIHDAVFASPDHTTTLSCLFELHGLSGRHRVFPLDESAPHYQAWLTSLTLPFAQTVTRSLSTAYMKEALSPSRFELHIESHASPKYEPERLVLDLPDAMKFLSRPFRIVVEDESSDRCFLLAHCATQQRDVICARLTAQFLEFRHGGGIDRMKPIAEELSADPTARYSSFVLFDSDSLQPNQPSASAKRLSAVCATLDFHQLTRRFMESYLPMSALSTWANERSRTPAQKRIFRAFAKLNRAQRHHFGMKYGLNGDRGRKNSGESDGGLYSELTSMDKLALSFGFGPDIGRLFASDRHVGEVHVRKDADGWQEVNAVVARILEAAQ